MGFQVKAWLRRKTVMLGSKGWEEREGEISAIASSRVARRGAARTQASKPALAVPPSDQLGKGRPGTACHGLGQRLLAKLHKANQLKSLDCRADPPQRSDIPTWHPAGRHILPIYFEYRPVRVWLKVL